MKVVFVRKSGDPEENDYFDCGILIEPLKGQSDYADRLLIGETMGKIGVMVSIST